MNKNEADHKFLLCLDGAGELISHCQTEFNDFLIRLLFNSIGRRVGVSCRAIIFSIEIRFFVIRLLLRLVVNYDGPMNDA